MGRSGGHAGRDLLTIIEVTRGNAVESAHDGHVAVLDADGRTLFEWGEPATPVYPRSAIKLLQAMPLIETGAADAFGFSDAELALACSSHSGEPEHVATARSMLAKAEVDETCLACGGHWSLRQNALIEQARAYDRKPGPICNNCSGKHAGFLTVCQQEGWPVEGYAHPDHPFQRMLAEHMANLTETPHDDRNRAIDGCSIPTYAVPLRSLALAFIKTNAATDRLAAAAMAHPFYTAGTARFCTDFMTAANGAAYVKTGAEGVFCARLSASGITIALKIADGATRASELALAVLANAFLDEDALRPFEGTTARSWAGEPVGQIRPAKPFRDAVLAAAAQTR